MIETRKQINSFNKTISTTHQQPDESKNATPILFSPLSQIGNLEQLGKVTGDSNDITPETERNPIKIKIRQDAFHHPIKKGSKKHQISFQDQIKGISISSVKYYIKEPKKYENDSSCCVIF